MPLRLRHELHTGVLHRLLQLLRIVHRLHLVRLVRGVWLVRGVRELRGLRQLLLTVTGLYREPLP